MGCLCTSTHLLRSPSEIWIKSLKINTNSKSLIIKCVGFAGRRTFWKPVKKPYRSDPSPSTVDSYWQRYLELSMLGSFFFWGRCLAVRQRLSRVWKLRHRFWPSRSRPTWGGREKRRSTETSIVPAPLRPLENRISPREESESWCKAWWDR